MPHGFAIARLRCPLGLIEIAATDLCLTSLTICTGEEGATLCPAGHGLLEMALDQLSGWFDRRSTGFNLPLAPASTMRGETLRSAIAAVGYGDTITYAGLARRHGSSPRAIGQACRRNPFPLIIPCHRILSDAGQQYYSGGGGADTKAWLVAFEAETLGQAPPAWAAQANLL